MDSLESRYKEKFVYMLLRNPDWETIRDIGRLLDGKMEYGLPNHADLNSQQIF